MTTSTRRTLRLASALFLFHVVLLSGCHRHRKTTSAPNTEDYADKGRAAALAIDGIPDTGWSVKGGVGQPHAAVFELAEDLDIEAAPPETLPHTRMIPSTVKLEVWQRDKGQCVLCGEKDNLHFDHDFPFSKGGSNTVENIRLLCESCNKQKGARIE